MTCHALNDRHHFLVITEIRARSPDKSVPIKGYSPPTSSSNGSSKNRHVVLVIVLVALHQTILSPEAKIRRRRCHSRSTTVPRSSRDCHVDPLLRIFRGGAGARCRVIGRYSITREFQRKLHEDDERTSRMDGDREKQTVKLRGQSLAVDWRASAYPTPLITGRHPLHPTARSPLRRITGTEPPRSSSTAC